MNPADKKLLNDAIDLIRSLDPVAAAKIQKQLDDCVTEISDRQAMVDLMKRADPLAYFWQGQWKELARAWVLAKLVASHVNIAYSAPDESTFGTYLNAIRTLPYEALKEDLVEMISGKAALSRILSSRSHGKRDLWDLGGFTHPKDHNPKKFRYIVHAMVPAVGFTGTKRRDFMKAKGREQFLTDDELKVADYYLTQTGVIKTEVLCCSIIDQEKTNTYRGSAFGFVLCVPKQNLVAAFSTDAASAAKIGRGRADRLVEMTDPLHRLIETDKFLEDLSGLYDSPLDSPDEILAASKQHDAHNELVVMGSLLGQSVRVAAIFVKTNSDKLLKSFVELDEKWNVSKSIHACAKRLEIPIVDIPEKAGEPSEIEFNQWKSGAAKQSSATTV